MSRTVSARISNELHNELREKCNHIGCNIGEYIEEAVKFMLHGSSDFDFGQDEEEENESKPELEKAKILRIE